MEDIKEIKDKISKVEDFMTKVSVELAVYNASLNEHMRRTEMLETKMDRHDRVIMAVVSVCGFITAFSGVAVALKNLHVF